MSSVQCRAFNHSNHEKVTSLSWHPSSDYNNYFLSTSYDGSVNLWDVSSNSNESNGLFFTHLGHLNDRTGPEKVHCAEWVGSGVGLQSHWTQSKPHASLFQSTHSSKVIPGLRESSNLFDDGNKCTVHSDKLRLNDDNNLTKTLDNNNNNSTGGGNKTCATDDLFDTPAMSEHLWNAIHSMRGGSVCEESKLSIQRDFLICSVSSPNEYELTGGTNHLTSDRCGVAVDTLANTSTSKDEDSCEKKDHGGGNESYNGIKEKNYKRHSIANINGNTSVGKDNKNMCQGGLIQIWRPTRLLHMFADEIVEKMGNC
ncbi:WD repeat protein [Reticulomyxa filosa]|uniref:WD repeat protein n=1 Tax=Reticulomyxa filosa TaxID=46433 RepID=X6M693_RETFI|nr:WD repeat protein [Reticulomyxa filosa]|eukprot:ETO09513.1 WD repeat protein [Reticulomyxa filosa]